MKKLLLVAAAAMTLLLSSCGSGMKVEMDNPTDQSITVKIDGDKEYTLGPNELIEVKGLKKGAHTMSVNGGSDIDFTLETRSLLNPTLSLYVTDVQEYSTTGGDMDTSDWVTVEIDGEEYYGPITLYENQAIIAMDKINLGVTQPFEEEIETLKNGSVFVTKLFRKADYLEYYDEAYY